MLDGGLDHGKVRGDVEVTRGEMAVVTDPEDFVVGDLRDMDLPECGLALLIDVLHYWDVDTQKSILHRVGDRSKPIPGLVRLRRRLKKN